MSMTMHMPGCTCGCAGPIVTSVEGFLVFVRGVMGIDPILLPDSSPIVAYALAVAQGAVNPALLAAGPMYSYAVYNLAGSSLITYAVDQPGRTYFSDLRASLGIHKFQSGVVSGTGDGGTSVSLLNPEFMRNLTLANLQQLKDPWGRAYLAIAQDYGPTIWGLS
jgi:hypothetical protein